MEKKRNINAASEQTPSWTLLRVTASNLSLSRIPVEELLGRGSIQTSWELQQQIEGGKEIHFPDDKEIVKSRRAERLDLLDLERRPWVSGCLIDNFVNRQIEVLSRRFRDVYQFHVVLSGSIPVGVIEIDDDMRGIRDKSSWYRNEFGQFGARPTRHGKRIDNTSPYRKSSSRQHRR